MYNIFPENGFKCSLTEAHKEHNEQVTAMSGRKALIQPK